MSLGIECLQCPCGLSIVTPLASVCRCLLTHLLERFCYFRVPCPLYEATLCTERYQNFALSAVILLQCLLTVQYRTLGNFRL